MKTSIDPSLRFLANDFVRSAATAKVEYDRELAKGQHDSFLYATAHANMMAANRVASEANIQFGEVWVRLSDRTVMPAASTSEVIAELPLS